ncbi:MAG: colanic acid exporter [Anaerolineae bacterium]|nr:MOP flippase family protein [Anaerolineales bacterium]MCQ3973515.1 colanic acid exporter [Anaerolineae bacterium]
MFDLKEKTLKGVAWITFAQIIKQVLQYGILIVLTRLLSPQEFGLVAMIVVFTGFIEMFRELGLGAALVQNQQVKDIHYTSVFWLNLVTGLVLTGLTFIAAPLIAMFYDEPRLTPLTSLVAVDFFITSLSITHGTILSRSMQFRLLAFVDIMAAGIAGAVAITLAMTGYGVWSLIWRTLINSIVETLILWRVSNWRPRWLFDRAAVTELLGFSSNLLAFNVLNYWVRNGDNLLIGKFIGTAELGIYARGYSMMTLPISQVTQVLGRVMFPALSTIQHDRARVKEIYLRAVAMIALVTFPLMLGLFTVAEPFVLTVFGVKWVQLVPLLRIFSLLGMVQSITVTIGWVLQSQGRTDLMLRWRLTTGIILFGGFVMGVWIGTIEAVALIYVFISGVVLPYPSFTFRSGLSGITFGDVVRSVTGVFVCAVTMASIVWAFGLLLPTNWFPWTYLVIKISLGITIYIILLHTFGVAPYREATILLAKQLGQWRGVPAKS